MDEYSNRAPAKSNPARAAAGQVKALMNRGRQVWDTAGDPCGPVAWYYDVPNISSSR
jgi:hypothetical protein